jgi:hypothetical protein
MRYRRLLLFLIAALIVASLSGFYEYDYIIRWDPCGSLKGRCPRGFVGAGFPLPFLIDSDGPLMLGESDFIWAAFVSNILIYLILGRLTTRFVAMIYRVLRRFAEWLRLEE